MKILLIDDNKSITTMLSKYLTAKGHDCVTTNDGRNGLTLIEQGKFDTILLDLAMPDFTGVDVIEALSSSGRMSDQKIVILTASSVNEGQIQDLLSKGAHACLKKPVKLDALMRTIGC